MMRWSASEIALLRKHYPDANTDDLANFMNRTRQQLLTKASKLKLRKSIEFQQRFIAELRSKGIPKQFSKASVPWNKGISFHAGGRSVEHQFRPGQLPKNHQPVGHERLNKGYLQRKVTDTGDTHADYRPVHHLVWEAAGRAPVPASHALIFRDGNRMNFDIDNLELVSREELMRRNSHHQYGPEISRLYQLVGVINRLINKTKRKDNR